MRNINLVTEAQSIIDTCTKETRRDLAIFEIENHLKYCRHCRLTGEITEEQHKRDIENKLRYLIAYYKCKI